MKTIITIGRQAGSGGKEIGEKLAAALGVKCYDRELLERAAKESGFCEEIFENHDEKPTRSFLYSLVMDTYSYGYSSAAYRDMPINHKVFLAQFDAIKKSQMKGHVSWLVVVQIMLWKIMIMYCVCFYMHHWRREQIV